MERRKKTKHQVHMPGSLAVQRTVSASTPSWLDKIDWQDNPERYARQTWAKINAWAEGQALNKSFDGSERVEGESSQSVIKRLDSYGIRREIDRLQWEAWQANPERYARRVWAQIKTWAEG